MSKFSSLMTILTFSVVQIFSFAQTNNQTYQSDSATQLNIDPSNYYELAVSGGQFFAWNQSADDQTTTKQLGIFTSDHAEASYLVDNQGTFTELPFQITNFWRIDDTKAIVTIKYYKNQSIEEYVNRNFLVTLTNNALTVVTDQPLLTNNTNFVSLNNNTDFILSYGYGLDAINITSGVVHQLIPPYADGSYHNTKFYALSSDSGIYVNSTGLYHYLSNITETAVADDQDINSTCAVNWSDNSGFDNNLVVLSDTSFIMRNSDNQLWYLNSPPENLNQAKPVALQYQSAVNIFGFKINDELVVLNLSSYNGSRAFGTPILATKKTDNSGFNFTTIQQAKTLTSLTYSPISNQGIFINNAANAFSFSIINNNLSPFTTIGNVATYVRINNNLGFATYQNQNFLYAFTKNDRWALSNTITVTALIPSRTTVNFLDTVVNPNSYFADNYLNLTVTNPDLTSVVITNRTTGDSQTLKPDLKKTISYDFTGYQRYQIAINFTPNISLLYYVMIDRFSESDLVHLNAPNVTSYVATTNNQLYDFQVTANINNFQVQAINPQVTQLIDNLKLIAYHNDKLVITSINNLNFNDTISIINVNFPAFIYSIKITTFLQQTTQLYFGFLNDKQQLPLPPFWQTNQGQQLRRQALLHGYSNSVLDHMNALQVNNLIVIANDWNTITVQGTTLAYIIIFIVGSGLIITIISLGYNAYLTNEIKKRNLKKVLIIKK